MPMMGWVKTRICPWYEGSVMLSGYPTTEVVKTTSPLVMGVLLDPKEIALNSSPELNRSDEGMGGERREEVPRADGFKKGVFVRVARVRLSKEVINKGFNFVRKYKPSSRAEWLGSSCLISSLSELLLLVRKCSLG